RSVMATAVAGNAISVSVPLAGPQLGTAFAYRRFRRLGIDSPLAGWVLIVSGVVSSLAAGLIVPGGSVLSGNHAVSMTAAIGGIVGEGALAVALLGVGLQRPSAVAAVLLYRLVSFWMATGVGWTVYLRGRRSDPKRSLALTRRRSWALSR